MLYKDAVLSAKNISKKYGTKSNSIFNKEKEENVFFALKDISFDLKKGEVLGIIGLNGAGKSTLLKILSEVIPPSSGEIEYCGSILSILDVGTGFHPDLSGYENIFLNASILGMKHSDVQKVIGDIIDFSGLKELINEPVKNYSNGMYLRLAMSIALFIKNDILLIDEVISVGDVDFKEKGIKKIKEQVKNGKSCIVISHDLETILEFCSSCILLEKGKIINYGTSKEVVSDYYNRYYNKQIPTPVKLKEQSNCEFSSINPIKNDFFMDEEIKIKINYTIKQKGDYRLFLTIRSHQAKIMTASNAFAQNNLFNNISEGNYEVLCTMPANIFNNGSYIVDLVIGTENEPYILFEQACRFNVMLKEWELEKSWNSFNEIIPFRPICAWESTVIES